MLTLGAGAALAAARWLGLRLPGLANHMVVGVAITLILVYELVAGSSGGTWSVPDAVQLALIVGMLVASTRSLGRRPMRFVLIAVVAAGVLAVQVGTGEQGVGWDDWGGLQLDAVRHLRRHRPLLPVRGAGGAGPPVVAAGPAHRSRSPTSRPFRGVPLVALLFMGQYVIPLFFPNTVEPPSSLARALIAIVLFEAAYIAETVRGGLQAVPRGQHEAAQAIGLSPWKVTRLIVLPQALRAVIPAMVGQFISLFKDTSLLRSSGSSSCWRWPRTCPASPSSWARGCTPSRSPSSPSSTGRGRTRCRARAGASSGRLGLGERR